MSRIATVPLERSLSASMQRAQQKLAVSQAQLATGKKAPDLAALGTEAVRTLSSRSLVAQQEAHAAVATRLGTTLSLYDTALSSIDSAAGSLRQSILDAIGTGQWVGVEEAADAAFAQVRSALNAREGGLPLFAGAQTTIDPFRPATLAETAGSDPADAFANDQIRATARVGDGIDIAYGLSASDVGTSLLAAFRTIAEAGAVGAEPTAAQRDAFARAIEQLDGGLADVRAQSADNGRRQAQVETLASRAVARSDLLNELISKNEDADLGQIATDLAQQKTLLQASYSVFSQLAGLTLIDYLR